MIDEHDLQAAVAEGIIDHAQAVRIAHVARLRRAEAVAGSTGPRAPDPDDERFRLIGGFNDVFVGIGVCLLAGALLGLARVLGFDNAFAATAMAAAWGLSEVFARRMRLALPSILLAVMFAGSAGVLAGILAGPQSLSAGGYRLDAGYTLAVGLVGFGLAALLHFWRFRVPIDLALTAGGVLGAIVAGLFTVVPAFMEGALDFVLVGGGLAVFAIALRLDMGDPNRVSRRSDSAFWLHLLAAGLIVHPVFRGIAFSGQIGSGSALLILSLFVLLGVVALVIDRRALLVSALSYAGIAIAYLITRSVSDNLALPLALLGLAVVVLALSAGWRRLRRLVVPRLPLGPLADRLPPVEAPLP